MDDFTQTLIHYKISIVLLAFISFYVLYKTILGKQVLAVGGNEKASILTGIPTKRIRLFVYGLSGIN